MGTAENIKKLRKEYGLNQAELGLIAGVTDKAVSTWEKGIKSPRMGALQRIADHFGLQKSNIIEDGGLDKALDKSYTPALDDPELSELLEELKNRDEMKILFKLAKDATKEDVMRAVAIIEALGKS